MNLGELLIVTPHASGALPPSTLRQMLGEHFFDVSAREALLRRAFLEGDPFTDLIFSVPGAEHLSAPWSRFAADLNRERDDTSDNGVLKLVDFAKLALYPPGFSFSPDAREARLRGIWDPFEQQLRALTAGKRLLIVGHSMAPYGPALSGDSGRARPAVTLMVGARHPSYPPQQVAALQAAAQQAFGPLTVGEAFTEIAVNTPWDADTISVRHHLLSGVAAFGIEVNAGLYLQSGQERPGQLAKLNAAFERFALAALRL